jgi:hypothetical protein
VKADVRSRNAVEAIARWFRRLANAVSSDRFEPAGVAAAVCVSGLVQALLAARYVGLAGSGPGDVQQYGLLAKQYAAAGATWTYSLWYVLVDLSVVKPSSDENWIAASLVLQGSVYFLKGAVLVLVVSLLGFRWPTALAVALLVGTATAFPWPGHDFYTGTFPGNTFTSITQSLSTVAVAFVAASLVVYLRRPNIARAAVLGAACVFLALCKPSWVPGLILAIGIVAAWRFGRHGRDVREAAAIATLVIAPALLVVLASYNATLGSEGVLAGRNLIWEPFRNWNMWSPTPLGDLLRSLAFPLSALPVLALARWWPSDARVTKRLHLAGAELQALTVAWIAFLVSLAIFLGWTEFIPGWGYPNDFNLAWGVQSSVFALNLLTAVVLLLVRTSFAFLPMSILFAQAATTVDWIVRIFPSIFGDPS